LAVAESLTICGALADAMPVAPVAEIAAMAATRAAMRTMRLVSFLRR
jgi:hypothetical protein